MNLHVVALLWAEVSKLLKRVGKHLWDYLLLIVFCGVVVALLWGAVKMGQNTKREQAENVTSPSYLREVNAANKRNWILSCINNGAAGVLGGATMSDTAIAQCGVLGDKLYPEKDWEHVAMINWERQQLGSSPQEEN